LLIFTIREHTTISTVVKRAKTEEPPETLELQGSTSQGPPPKIPCLTIAWHPDTARIGERAPLVGRGIIPPVKLSRLHPKFAPPVTPPAEAEGAPLGDRFLSRSPAELTVDRHGGVHVACTDKSEIIHAGEVIRERTFSAEEIARGVVLEMARVVLILHGIRSPAAPGPSRQMPRLGLVGESDAMEQLRADILRVADLPVPVLLRGETGTGKELCASALHRASARAAQSCISVNMAAIPASTAAAELFGHTRGAFTGAGTEHRGLFGRADGGTLFLDEVGETSGEVQAMLLRVLESGEIQPVGAHRTEKVDVRLLTATDADLEQACRAGRFREPLLHRLAGYQIAIPPLRARREDFGRLFLHFLREELEAVGELVRLQPSDNSNMWIQPGLVARLASLDWPGNVRQLRNVVRQLVISSRGADEVRVDPVLEKMIGVERALTPATGETPTALASTMKRKPSEITDDMLLDALRGNRWRTGATATALGISRTSLYALIGKSKRIRKAQDIPEDELRRCWKECGGDAGAMAEKLEASDRGILLRMKALGIAE
jgi:two-component system nitrogen regulation response regulator GlnG